VRCFDCRLVLAAVFDTVDLCLEDKLGVINDSGVIGRGFKRLASTSNYPLLALGQPVAREGQLIRAEAAVALGPQPCQRAGGGAGWRSGS